MPAWGHIVAWNSPGRVLSIRQDGAPDPFPGDAAMKAIFVMVSLVLFLPASVLRCADMPRARQGTDVQGKIRAGNLLRANPDPGRILLAGRSGPAHAPVKEMSDAGRVRPRKTAHPVKVEELSGRLVERGKGKKKRK